LESRNLNLFWLSPKSPCFHFGRKKRVRERGRKREGGKEINLKILWPAFRSPLLTYIITTSVTKRKI
jgi:hypothetical protein